MLALAGVGAVTLGQQLIARWRGERAAVATEAAPPTRWKLESVRGDAVLITFKITPRDARVFLDRELVPSNPVRLPKSERAHEIVVTADGYRQRVVEVLADRDRTVEISLSR